MITFCGVGTLLETPAVRAWLDRYQSSLAPWREFDATFWAGDPDAHRLPLAPRPDPPPVRLGVLWWPTGASRFATCHLLFDTARITKIRTAVGSRNATGELRVWDGTATAAGVANEVRTQMRVVAERRVFDVSGGHDLGLTLLTLADARYDWRLKPLAVTARPASWTALIASCAAALGVSLTPDTVDAALGQPSDLWVSSSRPATAVLDAALNAVGQRLVRRLDGTLDCQNWDTANAARAASPLPTRKTSGGSVAADVSLRESPEAVRVVFFRAGNSGTPYTKTNALNSLAVSAFGSAQGTLGQTASVYADGVRYDGTNAAACDAAALPLAKAWYGWRLGPSDLVLPGVYSPVLTGQEDAAEWDHSLAPAGDGYEVRTRLYSGAANWLPPGGPPTADGPAAVARNCREKLASRAAHDRLTATISGAVGLCADIDPATLILSRPDPAVERWVSAGTFKTALGATSLQLDFTDGGNPDLWAVGPASGSTPGAAYPLTYLGCDGDCPLFWGRPILCDSLPVTTCTLAAGGAPRRYRATVAAGSGDFAGMGSALAAKYTSGCSWSVASGTLTLTAGWADMGGSTRRIVVTLADSATGASVTWVGPTVAYTGTSTGCTDLGPLTRTASTGTGTPPAVPTLEAVGPCADESCADNGFLVKLCCKGHTKYAGCSADPLPSDSSTWPTCLVYRDNTGAVVRVVDIGPPSVSSPVMSSVASFSGGVEHCAGVARCMVGWYVPSFGTSGGLPTSLYLYYEPRADGGRGAWVRSFGGEVYYGGSLCTERGLCHAEFAGGCDDYANWNVANVAANDPAAGDAPFKIVFVVPPSGEIPTGGTITAEAGPCPTVPPPPSPPPPPPPPPPPAGNCTACTLIGHVATLVIPDGPNAGTYTGTWGASGGTSLASVAFTHPAPPVGGTPAAYCQNDGSTFIGFSGGSGTAGTSACGPPAVFTYPGAWAGSTGDVTITT